MRVTKKVEDIYVWFPQLVNSDKILLLKVWAYEGLNLTEDQRKKFMEVSSAESITRAARKLRQEPRFSKYVKENVRQERYNKFKGYKQGDLL